MLLGVMYKYKVKNSDKVYVEGVQTDKIFVVIM